MDFSTLDANPMERYIPNETEIMNMCDEYGIGRLLTIDGELGGLFNVNLRVTTTTGQYVFRIHSGLSRKDHIDAEERLLYKLRESDVPVLIPLRTSRGEYFLTLHHRFVQLTPYVSGTSFQHSEQQAFELGKTLRKFHDALIDEQEVPIPFWSNYPSNDILLEGMEMLREQQRGLHDVRLVREVEALYQMVMEQWRPKEDACVKTIIHGDWHPWNVIFHENGEVQYILDFDGLQRGERIHDIAYFIWSIRNIPDHERLVWNFMRGYGPISPVEKDMLPVAIARASVFFLCTASFVSNPDRELQEQMKVQRPYIEWILSNDGKQSIWNQVNII